MACVQDISDKTNGRWTKQQHENFILGLQMFGKNWKKIQELIGTRNGSQIRSHAQKFFLKFRKMQRSDSPAQTLQLLGRESQISNSKSQQQTQFKYSQYSYFLGKIFEYSTNQQQFDFWDQFIDHKDNQSTTQQQFQNKRKSSFEQFNEENQSECQLQLMSQPQKKIKS